MLFVLKKEQVEHARLRALAQSIIAKEKGKEVFDEYMKTAFPWLETQKQRDKNDHMQLLIQEVKKGGLSIKPLWEDQRSKGKGRTTVVDAHAPPMRSRTAQNKLYSKLGKVIPI